MRKLWKVAAAALPVLFIAGGLATPASAAPVGYGFDDEPQVIVGGGSDTTYAAMLSLTNLYNRSAGCVVQTTQGPNLGKCGSPQATNILGNNDHDTVAQSIPTGSSAGVASLNCFPASGQASIRMAGTVNLPPAGIGCNAASAAS